MEAEQQKTTNFEPDNEQLVFADAYIQSFGNIREAFELMERDRSIYYSKWKHQEGFVEWVNENARSEVLKRVGKWYLLLEKFAEKGSFRHLDMLLQIAKEFVPESPATLAPAPSRTYFFTSCVKCVKGEPHECEKCVEEGVTITP